MNDHVISSPTDPTKGADRGRPLGTADDDDGDGRGSVGGGEGLLGSFS